MPRQFDDKLIVGRRLQFTRPTFRDLTGQPPAFIPVLCPVLNIQESTEHDSGGRISSVATGQITKAGKVHRNFKFLPWYQGDIAETALDYDVLTGPMSGCILTSYIRAGHPVVGHIGTVTVTAAVPATINTNVKAVWTAFANAHPGDVIGGFNPTGGSVAAHPKFQPGDVGGETWGLLTTDGRFYAVQVYKQGELRDKGGTVLRAAPVLDEWRIAAVRKVTSMTLAQLQNI
jgi:hypothetical protein